MLYYSSIGTFEIVEYKGKIELYHFPEQKLIGTFDSYEQAVEMIQSLEEQG